MKTTTLLFGLCASLLSTAQTITPDFTFDKWETGTVMGEKFNTVHGWGCSNINNVVFKDEEMVEKTTDAYEGEYAMKLINKPNANQMSAGAMTMSPLPGNEFNDRFPLTKKVTLLAGYFKYEPVEGDTFSISIMLYKGGSPIAYGNYSNGDTRKDYTSFKAPIRYFISQVPDSASISIWVSRDGFKEGSILTIDNFTLTGDFTGISENTQPVFKCEVSPNPSQGIFNIQYEQIRSGNTTIRVYDVLGNLVKQFNHTRDVGMQGYTIDCTDLKQGIYLLKLDQAGIDRTIRIAIQ